LSATSLKSTKWRFSSLNLQNLDFFSIVPESPTHTGLIRAKTLEPNTSKLGPFKIKYILQLYTSRSILRVYKSTEDQPMSDTFLFRYHNGVKVQDTAKYQVGFIIYHILNPFECRMSTWVFIPRSSNYGRFASFKMIL
jgi:hypothetical protein